MLQLPNFGHKQIWKIICLVLIIPHALGCVVWKDIKERKGADVAGLLHPYRQFIENAAQFTSGYVERCTELI